MPLLTTPEDTRSVATSRRDNDDVQIDHDMHGIGELRNTHDDRLGHRRLEDSEGVNTVSPAILSSKTQGHIVASTPKLDLADFFSSETFEIVLHNPTTAHQLSKYAQRHMCGENMEFLEKVDRYNTLLEDLTNLVADITQSHVAEEAPKQMAIDASTLRKLDQRTMRISSDVLPSLRAVYADAQIETEQLLRSSVYPRFVKDQISKSAVMGLSLGRKNYQGLGDCFCLTDPKKADNPILYASDGFVAVTGYSRDEIIPRNCRFLQGNTTDRMAVERLRKSILHKDETVELLLNYKKNGEPFWNLLYVAPLYDAEGEVVFYIGGQINCSTTIRSNTDVLRVLSISDEKPDIENAEDMAQPNKMTKLWPFHLSARKSMHSLKRNTKSSDEADTGMESTLLKQIAKMNFRAQMEQFYTAYSRYMVVEYPAWSIRHFSRGVIDLLGVLTGSEHGEIGNNAFKFLARHTLAIPKDYKSKVQRSLKNGKAITIGVDLLTLRNLPQRTEEAFSTHWTPTKDEGGNTRYIIVTLSSNAVNIPRQ